MTQTRDQQRAHNAHEIIAIAEKKSEAADYGRQCKNLPGLIHEAGLCQALAFLRSKKRDDLANDLARVMAVEDLDQEARSADLGRYLFLSREALASAQWMKRYAEAHGLVKDEDATS